MFLWLTARLTRNCLELFHEAAVKHILGGNENHDNDDDDDDDDDVIMIKIMEMRPTN